MNGFDRKDGERVRHEIYELADAFLCDGLSDDEVRRLEKLLCEDTEARRHYVRFMHQSAKLCRLSTALMDAPPEEGAAASLASAPRAQPSLGTPASFAPPSPFVGHLLPPVGMLLTYVVAVMVAGTSMLAAWAWKASGDVGRLAASARHTVATPRPAVVGKITGMKDCRWGEPAAATEKGADVCLGRKYHLVAGSLEITFQSGAKVTLQGPAVFEVESKSGGFLSSGSMTAHGDAPEKPGARESDAYKSEVIKQPFLYVRIPNPAAPMFLVADRAAEFRVSIGKPPEISVFLVRGLVVARLASTGHLKETSLPDLGATVTAGGNATYRFELFSSASEPSLTSAQQASKAASVYSVEKKKPDRNLPEKKGKGQVPAS
jgi:hypothetical protein